MYHDYQRPSRDDWKYPYEGSVLIEPAKKKLLEFTEAETQARVGMAKLLCDPSRNVRDDASRKFETAIEFNATQKEACQVFLHEFIRSPKRAFSLSLSDVVYFGLHNDSKEN